MAEATSDIWQEIEQAIEQIDERFQLLRCMIEELRMDEAEQAGKQAYAMQQEGGTLPPGSERAAGRRGGNGTIHAVACGSASLNIKSSEDSGSHNSLNKSYSKIGPDNFGSHRSENMGPISGFGSHGSDIGSSSRKGSHSDSGLGFGDGSYSELSDRQVMAMIMVHGKEDGLSAEEYARGWGASPEAAQTWGYQEKLKRAEVLLLHAMADLDRYREEYGPLPDSGGKLADWKRRARAHLSGSIVHDDIPGDKGGQGPKPDWPVIQCPLCGGARKWKQGKVLKGWVRRCEECGGEE